MYITTLNRLSEHSPYEPGWRRLLAALGKVQADDEPLSLRRILAICGLEDAVWALRAHIPQPSDGETISKFLKRRERQQLMALLWIFFAFIVWTGAWIAMSTVQIVSPSISEAAIWGAECFALAFFCAPRLVGEKRTLRTSTVSAGYFKFILLFFLCVFLFIGDFGLATSRDIALAAAGGCVAAGLVIKPIWDSARAAINKDFQATFCWRYE